MHATPQLSKSSLRWTENTLAICTEVRSCLAVLARIIPCNVVCCLPQAKSPALGQICMDSVLGSAKTISACLGYGIHTTVHEASRPRQHKSP